MTDLAEVGRDHQDPTGWPTQGGTVAGRVGKFYALADDIAALRDDEVAAYVKVFKRLFLL